MILEINKYIYTLRVRLDPRLLRFTFLHFPFFFFFFSMPFPPTGSTVHVRYMNNSRTFDRSSVNSASVHCSRTYKFHFLSIFSLKIGPTALFTHLKIILLPCFQFSVFSFSKISSIQTDPK